MNSVEFLNRILEVIKEEIIPETVSDVKKGNKVFGGAILKKSDLSTVVIGTNKEIVNPLFHGEISTLNNYFELSKSYSIKDLLFVSTHEPCPMCLSAITWAGFDNIYYFFDYNNTHKLFNIPHDLNILKDVFGRRDGEYERRNSFWVSYWIKTLIEQEENSKKKMLLEKAKLITEKYKYLSEFYQKSKQENDIPLN